MNLPRINLVVHYEHIFGVGGHDPQLLVGPAHLREGRLRNVGSR